MANWEPAPEEYLGVIAEQNPWHTTGLVPSALAPPHQRPFAQWLWQRVTKDDPRRFQLVLGPRRAGKTTAMYQTVQHLIDAGNEPRRLWWLRLDHPLLLTVPLGTLVDEIIRQSGAIAENPTYLFLDEIVYAQQWDVWLKTFYDEHKPVRIVATSSATAALVDRKYESGVGRWEDQFLNPYLLTEYLDLADQPYPLVPASTLNATIEAAIERPHLISDVTELRRRFVLTGGFPELLVRELADGVKSDDTSLLLDSQRILRSDAVERAVYKDIPQSFKVDNPLLLERLLYVLAGQVSQLLSPTNISKALDGMSQPTFDKYLSYLEKAFLVFTLPNYSGQESSVQRRGRKLYFSDGAIRNAALQRGLRTLDDPTEMGLLNENLAASHLHALAMEESTRLFHWRDGNDEVDLVYDHGTEPLAFEIGSSPKHSRAGLHTFSDRYSRFKGRCYLVAPGAPAVAPSRSPSGVGTLPLDLFLSCVGKQSEVAMKARLRVAK